MKKILLISDDQLEDKVAGFGQRYRELALALAQEFSVSVLSPSDTQVRINLLGIKVLVPNPEIKKALGQFDAIISQGITLLSLGLLPSFKKPIIIDLACPWFLENLEKNGGRLNLAPLKRILNRGSFFICNNEKQRDYYLGILSALGKITPATYQADPSLRTLIDLVPTGISTTPPQHSKKVLKGIYQPIREQDKVIVWWGGIWEWLDPFTPIKAMAILKQQRADIKLVFIGIKHPQQPLSEKANQAIDLAKKLGVYNQNVIFLPEWIDYDQRGNWLMEADLGLISQQPSLETTYSWRTRVLDYFWANLPTITTCGDSLAETISRYGLGEVVPCSDPGAMAQAIVKLLSDLALYQAIKKNQAQFKPQLYWDKAIQPIKGYLSGAPGND